MKQFVKRESGIRSLLLAFGLVALCGGIAAESRAQDFCPPAPIPLCGIPQTEQCVPLVLTGATNITVTGPGATWANDQLCVVPPSYGETDITIAYDLEGVPETCVVTIILNPGVTPDITCPEDSFEIVMCSPGLACIAAPLARDARQMFAQGGSVIDDELCVNVDTSGTYKITVYAVNECGADSCDVFVKVTVNSRPEIACPIIDGPIALERCGEGQLCYPLGITDADNISVSGGATYVDGSVCFSADTSGMYSFTAYAQNGCGVTECVLLFAVTIKNAPEIICEFDGGADDGGVRTVRSAQTCPGEETCIPLEILDATTVTASIGTYVDGQFCFLPDTTGQYHVVIIATNECGEDTCGFTIFAEVIEPPVIVCENPASVVPVCAPGELCVDLPITGATNVVVEGATWAKGQLCFNVTESGSYTFAVVATNECGSAECEITVAVAIGPPVIACTDEVISFETCILPDTLRYKLSVENADTVFTSVAGSVYAGGVLSVPIDTLLTSFTIFAINSCGTDSCIKSINVSLLPSPLIACPDTTVSLHICAIPGGACLPLNIDFADTVIIRTIDSAGEVQVTWKEDSLAVIVTDTGLYRFLIVARNGCGDDSCEITVDVELAPATTIACPVEPIPVGPLCGPQSVEIELPIENATKVSVSEGGSWNGGILTVQISESGLFTYTVIATGECGSDTCDVTIGAEVGDSTAPTIACPLTEQTGAVCAIPDTIRLPLKIARAGKVIVFSDDAPASWAKGTLSFVATREGLFTFTVVAQNECGSDTCRLSVNVIVTDGPVIACPGEPVPVAIGAAGEVCIPLEISGADDIAISGSGNPTYVDGELCFTAETAGDYQFAIDATNECGAASCTLTVSVEFGQPPVACFEPIPASGVVPLTVQFDNCTIFDEDDDVNFSWDFGNGATSTEFEPEYTYLEPGCYLVTLTVSNEFGSSTDTATVCVSEGEMVIPTYEWINIYCSNPLLDSLALVPGDIVTAYDPDGVLCGMDVVREDGKFGFMPVYIDDPFSPSVDEGAEPGDQISFRVNGEPVFTSPAIVWTSNGDSFELCDFRSQAPKVCKTLQLNEGWNLVSWDITFSSGIEEFISQYDGCIDLVLGFDRGALTYDPDLPQFSTLWNIDYHYGYWFKMNCSLMVEMCGDAIDLAGDAIDIYSGWNLVAYWPAETLLVEDALGSLGSTVAVSLGWDGTGYLVYEPGQGSFNTLTEMSSCNGYWVKSTANGVLSYSGTPVSGLVADDGHSTSVSSSQWMSAYASSITIDERPVHDASIAFVSKDGTPLGNAEYRGGLLKFTPIYGADGAQNQLVKPGEAVQVLVNGQRTYPDLLWREHGASVDISRRYSTADASVPDEFSLSQNYPNPFNPSTTISFSLAQSGVVRLSVYNLLGQVIATVIDEQLPAGTYTAEWNGKDDRGEAVSSGVYFYRLDAGEFSQTRKMVLTK